MPPFKTTSNVKKKTKKATVKNKRKNFKYTEEALAKALQAIRSQSKSIREACREYGVPRSTVQDRISGRIPDQPRKVGPEPLLGFAGEKKVVNWIIDLAKCGIPVTKAQLLDTVSHLLKDLGKGDKLPVLDDNKKLPKIGQTWYLSFRKRNPEIAVREPEAINKAREAVTESKIRNWFSELELFLEERGLSYLMNDPDRIFNADETGVSLCPKSGKVLAPRGYKNVYTVKKGTEKDNLTVLIMMNGSGKIAPPLIVYPYVKPPKAVVNNMPPGWILGKSETGWMRSDVFFEYIANDFNGWLEDNNIIKPVILFVDGHRSHMSMSLSIFCEENGIILYALPPNTTHIMQPADVSVFRPLKQEWKNTVRNWQAKPENSNKSVTKTNFAKVFEETLNKDMSVSIKNGFRRCGLFPFNVEAVDYTKCVKDFQIRKNQINPTMRGGFSEQDYITAKNVIMSIKDNLSRKGIDAISVCNELEMAQSSLTPKRRSTSKTPRKSTEIAKPKSPKTSQRKSTEFVQPKTPKTSEHILKNDDAADKNVDNFSLHEDISIPDVGSYVSLDDISGVKNISEISILNNISVNFNNSNIVTIEDVDRNISPRSSVLEKLTTPVENEKRDNTLKSPYITQKENVNDPFAKHLRYPVDSTKLITKKQINMTKYPSAISSKKWRDLYNLKEDQKQKLIEAKNKRKMQRENNKKESTAKTAKKRKMCIQKKTSTSKGKKKSKSDASPETSSSDTDSDFILTRITNRKRERKQKEKKNSVNGNFSERDQSKEENEEQAAVEENTEREETGKEKYPTSTSKGKKKSKSDASPETSSSDTDSDFILTRITNRKIERKQKEKKNSVGGNFSERDQSKEEKEEQAAVEENTEREETGKEKYPNYNKIEDQLQVAGFSGGKVDLKVELEDKYESQIAGSEENSRIDIEIELEEEDDLCIF